MSTGNFENWAGDVSQIGPIYPFVGTETILVIALIVFTVVWFGIAASKENTMLNGENRKLNMDEVKSSLEE